MRWFVPLGVVASLVWGLLFVVPQARPLTVRWSVLGRVIAVPVNGGAPRPASLAAALVPVAAAGPVSEVGVLHGPPSLTAEEVDQILGAAGSPAVGTGAAFVQLGVQYGIDDAYALAFFLHESSLGTACPGWAGCKPDGSTTHDIGNIVCAGYVTCYGRFRDYPTWEAGIEDWYRLIAVEYVQGRGFTTVDEVVPVYAPSFENDVSGYKNAISATVGQWRQQYP